MELTYFATNNRATTDDMDVLHAMGIRILEPSRSPMTAFRDPDSGRVRIEIGTVTVRRDGLIKIRPRLDAPRSAITVLVRTAVECLERELHRRDRWAYRRATSSRPGSWHVVISVNAPEQGSIFDAFTEALAPAARPRVMQSDRDDEIAPEQSRTVAA